MNLDRKQFLALAVGMSLGTSCAPTSHAPAPAAPRPGGGVVTPTCVGFDPTNECVAWADGSRASGYAMTSECVRWDPTDECTAWEYTRE